MNKNWLNHLKEHITWQIYFLLLLPKVRDWKGAWLWTCCTAAFLLLRLFISSSNFFLSSSSFFFSSACCFFKASNFEWSYKYTQNSSKTQARSENLVKNLKNMKSTSDEKEICWVDIAKIMESDLWTISFTVFFIPGTLTATVKTYIILS